MQTIGEAARLSGVRIETIRYYERHGVVPAPGRTASGRRAYDAEAIARLRFVKRCRDLGFPLAEVRTLLGLSADTERVCGEVRQIGEGHLRHVRAKLADLARLEEALVELIDDCDEGRSGCPALRRLFAETAGDDAAGVDLAGGGDNSS